MNRSAVTSELLATNVVGENENEIRPLLCGEQGWLGSKLSSFDKKVAKINFGTAEGFLIREEY